MQLLIHFWFSYAMQSIHLIHFLKLDRIVHIKHTTCNLNFLNKNMDSTIKIWCRRIVFTNTKDDIIRCGKTKYIYSEDTTTSWTGTHTAFTKLWTCLSIVFLSRFRPLNINYQSFMCELKISSCQLFLRIKSIPWIIGKLRNRPRDTLWICMFFSETFQEQWLS
jgi:hypothetical protein